MAQHGDQSVHRGRSRRAVLGGAATVAGVAALPGLVAAAATTGRQVAGYRPALLPSAATLNGWLKQLHKFGPIRATGTPQCRAFEEFLAAGFAGLGCAVERDSYRLTSWECDLARDCAITVHEDGGAHRTLEVVSYYPFCGTTRGTGPVTGRVLHAGVGADAAKAFLDKADPEALKQAIVVIDLPITFASMERIKLYPERFGAYDPLARIGAPSAAAAGGAGLMRALEGRCKGLVLCYTDVSDEAARYNWLPFSEPHGKVPGLWVGRDSGAYLRSVSGKATLSLRCDAKLTPDSRADTIVATLKGQSDEVVMLTTQTDGPNECNENGGLGVLACATYLAKLPLSARRRTYVFSLPTGHYAAGAVADPVTGSGRRAGTFGVLEKRPELMKRVVAQVAMEQMAAMEWVDLDGRFVPSGRVAPQFWLPTNQNAIAMRANPNGPIKGTAETAAAARRMFAASAIGEDPKLANDGLVESGYAPGEGGVLRAMGIPGIGLMGSPSYFFRADPKGVIDKLDPRVMRTEVAILVKMLTLMDRLSPDQLKGLAPIGDADLFG